MEKDRQRSKKNYYLHREERLAYRKHYYMKNKEKCHERYKKYYQQHHEELLNKQKQYIKINKDKIAIKRKQYYQLNRERLCAISREYNKSHKTQISVINKKKHDALKLECINVYSNGKNVCACCGESHVVFLALDHVNNDGNKQRKEWFGKNSRSGRGTYERLKAGGWPNKDHYQILCWNCNWAKSHGGCPHKIKEVDKYE